MTGELIKPTQALAYGDRLSLWFTNEPTFGLDIFEPTPAEFWEEVAEQVNGREAAFAKRGDRHYNRAKDTRYFLRVDPTQPHFRGYDREADGDPVIVEVPVLVISAEELTDLEWGRADGSAEANVAYGALAVAAVLVGLFALAPVLTEVRRIAVGFTKAEEEGEPTSAPQAVSALALFGTVAVLVWAAVKFKKA